MNRLLAANFARLWRSRIFHVLEIFMIGYSVLIYTDTYITVRVNHKEYENWNLFFFNEMLFIGVALAIFVSIYIGVEYSNGTIRNKLSVGHSRIHIYMANLLVCYAAGIIACITYSVTSLILGLALIGKETAAGLWKPAQGMLFVLFILMSYTAIFVLVSMSDMHTVRAAVVSLLLSLIILGAGLIVCQYLDMPEYTVRLTTVVDESGGTKTIEETVYNSRYLTGTKRKIYEGAELILPSAQVMYVADYGISYSVKQPICMFGVSAVCTGAGIWIFRRKDIK
ncbi:MAG: ABC transporter permease [Lachnospiraceae bacterium]|nr:ABC transporter permease [Lachnospiraceae bacterium]